VSPRMIWVVRLIGIVVFLVLMYLLMSLHARLVRMSEEGGGGGRPMTSWIRYCESRIAERFASVSSRSSDPRSGEQAEKACRVCTAAPEVASVVT